MKIFSLSNQTSFTLTFQPLAEQFSLVDKNLFYP